MHRVNVCKNHRDCLCDKKKKMNKLGDYCIEHVRGCLASLSLLTVRVVALEHSQLHKKAYNLVVCEFGGLENVLCDAGVRAIPT